MSRLRKVQGPLAAAALGVATAILSAAVAVPGRAQNAARASVVAIDNFTFTPPTLVAKAGTTVTWINHDDIPHAVTTVSQLFKSKVLDTDNSYSFTFTTPGTYAYFCALHPHMTGTIVVEAQTGGAGP